MGSGLHFALQRSAGPNVRFGSLADISSSHHETTPPDEFFARNSGVRLCPAKILTSSSMRLMIFSPRICEPDADSAPGNDCKASLGCAISNSSDEIALASRSNQTLIWSISGRSQRAFPNAGPALAKFFAQSLQSMQPRLPAPRAL